METVVLVLCWLGVFHSSPLELYFLTAKSNNSSHVFLGATLIFFLFTLLSFIDRPHIGEPGRVLHDSNKIYPSIGGIAIESGSIPFHLLLYQKCMGITFSAFKKNAGET